MKTITRITKFLFNICNYLQSIQSSMDLLLERLNHTTPPAAPAEDRVLDSFAVRLILGISASTLYRHKRKKILEPFQTLGKRDYYLESEVIRNKERYQKSNSK